MSNAPMSNVVDIRASLPVTHTIATAAIPLRKNGYVPLPIKPGQKGVFVTGWTRLDVTEAVVNEWITKGVGRGPMGHWGVGLRGDRTLAIDIDVSDPDVVGNLLDFCDVSFGATCRRIGRPPRTLILFRSEGAVRYLASKKFQSPDGAEHRIEVLGDKGHQFVAYAIHPGTGKPYEWSGGDPLTVPVEQLPVLTREGAGALIEHFESIVPSDWSVKEKGSAGYAGERRGNPRKTASLRRLRSAMACIPNEDMPYRGWNDLTLALWAGVGQEKDAGFEIFDEFSAKNTAKYDFDNNYRIWNAITEVHSLGAGTIFREARQHGWVDPGEDTSADLQVVEGIFDAGVGATSGAHNDNPDVRTGDGAGAPCNYPSDAQGGATKQKPRGFYTVGFKEAADRALADPAPELIEGVLQEGTTALIFGPTHTGKTFLVVDMAGAVASGLPWAGRKTTKGAVLYVAPEGNANLPKRFAALRRKGIPNDTLLFLAPCPVNLYRSAADAAAIIAEAKRIAQECGHNVRLVILDTLAQSIAGADESAATDVAVVMERAQAISSQLGATVLAIHHTGKDATKGARGSSAIPAAVDTEIEIRTSKGSMRGEIACLKQRDGAKFAPIQYQLEEVYLGARPDGRAITSCVVRYEGGEGHGIVSGIAEKWLEALELGCGGKGSSDEWAAAYRTMLDPDWQGKPESEWPRGASVSRLRDVRPELENAGRVKKSGRHYVVI